MSWQQYVDSNLVGTGTVTSAGIYDKAGNPWAYSAGFAAQVAEVKVVARASATGDPSCLAGTGAVVAGVKYTLELELSDGSHHQVVVWDQPWKEQRHQLVEHKVLS